jgi:serine/threonine-protein kinase ULK4
VFQATKNENLKISCAVALANLVLLDNHLVDLVVYGLGLK